MRDAQEWTQLVRASPRSNQRDGQRDIGMERDGQREEAKLTEMEREGKLRGMERERGS